MALTFALLDAKLARKIARQPAEFEWKGRRYACSAGDVTRSKTTGLEGLEPEFDVILRTRVSLFQSLGERPQRGQLLTYQNQSYSIVSDTVSGDGVQLTLSCNAATR